MTFNDKIPVKEIVVISTILVWIVVYVFGPSSWLYWEASRLFGKSEVTVVESLGEPRVSLTADEMKTLTPEQYPWDYAGKSLPYQVKNKILHYSAGSGGVLIYINKEGNVEYLVATDP